ncbi:PRA1 family protein-domain-containing protein [Dactylonectria estremocensis]|uniref:PRA1 family protein-domain-containing protein n=1 Tax=Dactylonectria estremocensis TaxID=1079267 RepID=A0A9P9FJB3_9HYPO|nr:PRA1 family protein-domain-containing protein [Dactylonectria estremocensis]
MARIQIPLDAITSRLNLGERFSGLRAGPLSGRFSNLRPVSEFFDFKRVSKPANFVEAQSRVNYNLSYFSSNYAVVFVMLSIYALLTNWLLMFDIIFVLAGLFVIGRLDGHDLEIGTFRATTSQLYTGIIVISVPLGGLGGRPRSPEFAPQWGRPSRRRRRRKDGDAALYGRGDGDARVEELGADEEDTDSQGVGDSSRTVTRFVSDSLRFTGIDLGNREGGASRRGYYAGSDEDEEDDDSSSGDDDDYEEQLARMPLQEREEWLVQSAMARIERARAQGRSDVDLNKHELAALDRRQKRMEEEAKKKRKGERKKKKGQRIAVPLTQLEPASRKNKGSQPDVLPRYPSSSSNLGDAQDDQGYPRMGYFPPPTASRSRARSGASSSQRQPSRARTEREAEYMSGSVSTTRHASDTVATRRSGRGSPPEEPWVPNVSPTTSRSAHDPFQFQTEGPRTRSSRRPASGPAELAYPTRRGAAAPASRSGHGSRRQSVDEETSEDDSENSSEADDEDYSIEADTSSSDQTGNGAQIRETPRGRAAAIVAEADAEREPKSQPAKKSASKNHSPVKRKPVRGGRRKK